MTDTPTILAHKHPADPSVFTPEGLLSEADGTRDALAVILAAARAWQRAQ